MFKQLYTFEMSKQKNQEEIKLSIAGYYKIIKQLQEKIKLNNKEIEKFNKTIEKNLKQIETLKEDNQTIITYFKEEMENIKQLHNCVLIKDNDNCDKHISEIKQNIKKLETVLDKVSNICCCANM